MSQRQQQPRNPEPNADPLSERQSKERTRKKTSIEAEKGKTVSRKAIERWEDEGGPPPPDENKRSG